VDPVLQRVVDAAVADLERRPETGAGTVEVALARRETFPDSSLGCPQPGMFYTQALVDGFRVVLVRDGRRWLYTAGRSGVPRLCESGGKGIDGKGSGGSGSDGPPSS